MHLLKLIELYNKKSELYMCTYILIYLNNFAIYLKLTKHYKSTTFPNF